MRGVCVATCGLDVSGWNTALGPDVTPVAHICRAPSAWDVRHEGSTTRVFEVAVRSMMDAATFELAEWQLDLSDPEPNAIGTVTVDLDPGEMVALGDYVSISPNGNAVIFGYTTFGGSAGGTPGTVFDVLTASGEATSIAAPGNFEAAWLDDGELIVNGLGLGTIEAGQGLYRAEIAPSGFVTSHLVANLGCFSGAVAVAPQFVLAGGFCGFGSTWPDGEEEHRIIVIPRSALSDPGALPLDAAEYAEVTTPSGESLGSTFDLLSDGSLVVLDRNADAAAPPLILYEATYDDTTSPPSITLSAGRVLSSDGTFVAARRTADGRLLLAHFDMTSFTVVSLLLAELSGG